MEFCGEHWQHWVEVTRCSNGCFDLVIIIVFIHFYSRHGRQGKWLCWHQKVSSSISGRCLVKECVQQLLQCTCTFSWIHSLWPHSPVENGQLPDPANWGVADVVNYFKATGFEEQATAFQDQVGVLFLLRIRVAWWKPTWMSVRYFSLHLTGNRWQVPAPDDSQRRPDRAVNKARPCTENLRVSREAAANSTPEDKRLVAPQAVSTPTSVTIIVSGDPRLAAASQRLLWPQWHLNRIWMLYVFISVDPKMGCTWSPLRCLPFQPFLFLLLEICIFICCVFYLKEGNLGRTWFCVYVCVHKCVFVRVCKVNQLLLV